MTIKCKVCETEIKRFYGNSLRVMADGPVMTTERAYQVFTQCPECKRRAVGPIEKTLIEAHCEAVKEFDEMPMFPGGFGHW